jgi:hypothetical protein
MNFYGVELVVYSLFMFFFIIIGGERFPTLIPFHFTFPFSPKRLDGTELFT